MTSSNRLVSVVVPVYNGARFVAEAIDSALGQSWEPLEVVVVDDGSDDSTAEVLGRYRSVIRVVSQPHGGVAVARNAGIAAARGEVVVHLDSDDLLVPGSVRVRMAALVEEPALDGVTGHVEQFFDPGMDAAARQRVSCPEEALPGVTVGALLVKRSFFDRVGWLNPSLKAGADMDWMMRANEASMRLQVLPDVVLRRRIHGANMGLAEDGALSNKLRIIKQALDRRRREGGSP